MACVQAQTYPNLVHVVLDNASTDTTPSIIDSFHGKRVPLLTARNPETIPPRPNFNRVVGLQPKEAAYFCVLYADDLMLPHAIERMASIMEREANVDMVAAAQPDPKWGGWPPGDVFEGRRIAAAFLRGDLPAAFAHCLYRKRALEARADGFFDVAMNSADTDVALAVMLRGKIGYVHEPSVITRQHDESISARDLAEARLHYADLVVMLARHGRKALGPAEARAVARRLKRYYFRRMLRWGIVERNHERVRRHVERLSIADAAPTILDYADAVVDWPLRKLGVRPHWDKFGY
jgi:glycosyltransferase involved in cell wall biosynthesis